jgi:hypothetical protein
MLAVMMAAIQPKIMASTLRHESGPWPKNARAFTAPLASKDPTETILWLSPDCSTPQKSGVVGKL